jgi:hypothetical protein
VALFTGYSWLIFIVALAGATSAERDTITRR